MSSKGKFTHVLIWVALLSFVGVLYVRDGRQFLAAQSQAMKARAQESAAGAKAAAEVTPANGASTPIPAASGSADNDHDSDDDDDGDGDDEFDGATAGATNAAATDPEEPEESTAKGQTSAPARERVHVTVRFCTS